MSGSRGFVAAGHPLSAEAGARVLREGGNAVDAAIAAMLTSWVAEPLLTGPGAGGYMLIAGAGEEPVLLDFFVEAPGRGADPASRCDLIACEVSFGDAKQVFNAGAASCGTYGNPAGICEAAARWGSIPLSELAGPAAALARDGVEINAQQAFVFELLEPLLLSAPEGAGHLVRDGRPLRAGEVFRDPELADTIDRLGAEGARPFYEGDIADALVRFLRERGGTVTHEDLRAYAPVDREPIRARYRGRDILTNPPPNAGGILLALALQRLDAAEGPPALGDIVSVMEQVQAHRTPEFTNGLADPAYVDQFMAVHLGNTTHVSVMDGEGLAASVTCTNGEGCGLVVPGTGIHVNNIMGEEDLSPAGFHLAPPGTRMPSMMAPTVVLRDGEVELVVGSAGSNRIRSAILQVIVGVVDHGMAAGEAILAPRVHFEEGIVYAEPGVPVEELDGYEIVRFRDLNLFFGGAQAIERDAATGELSGAGDPRRGGAAVEA